MPNPNTNFKRSDGVDLGSLGWIPKEYLMSVYPQIANQLITPELWVWGNNSYGRLGTNDINTRCTPVTSSAGGANWKQVSCGFYHAAAIKTDGTLWTWGRNAFGQLGTNDDINRSTPVQTFVGGADWKQVSCGWEYIAAIKTDGTLWNWGRNNFGQLGINIAGITNKYTPVQTFVGGTNWKQVTSNGYSYTVAIKTDGTLWGWGRNATGALGTGDTTDRYTPVQTFIGGTNWKQVNCGNTHTAAIKTDGTLWSWGANDFGQLGVNDTTQRNSPVQTFVGGTNWKQVSCNGTHSTAIKTDGTLWTWGRNSYGQLGTNDTSQRQIPVQTFTGGTNWKQVAAGQSHTAAIKTDGTLWNWGRNNTGQLGINLAGASTNICTPVTTFTGGTNWKQVSCGYVYTAAIKTSDDLLGI